ncbi:mucin-associated surface protein (MASP), putative, partial [Trypanosoma cruzi]
MKRRFCLIHFLFALLPDSQPFCLFFFRCCDFSVFYLFLVWRAVSEFRNRTDSLCLMVCASCRLSLCGGCAWCSCRFSLLLPSLCVDGALVCAEGYTQVTGVMAMMMTGRVLLVCALCVLWCGAGCGFAKEKAVQDVQRDVSGDDERHKKETGKEENKSQPEKNEGGNNAEVPPPPPPVATQPGQAPTSQGPPSAQLTNETIKPEDPAGKDITRVQTTTPQRPEVEEAEPAGKTPEEEKKGTKEKEVDQKEQKGKDEKEHEQPQEQQQQQQQFERGKELLPLASPLGGEATQRSLSTVKSQELQQEHLTAGATEHLEKGVPSVSTQSASNGKTNSPTQSATPIAAVTAVTTEADKEKAKSRNDTESPEAAVTKRGEKHEKPTENDKTLTTDTKAVGRNDTGTHDDTDSSTAATTAVGTDN